MEVVSPVSGLWPRPDGDTGSPTTAELPTVTLQVLPLTAGAHASMGSGFTVLALGDLGEPDTAYVGHALGAAHVTGERDVALAGSSSNSCVPWP